MNNQKLPKCVLETRTRGEEDKVRTKIALTKTTDILFNHTRVPFVEIVISKKYSFKRKKTSKILIHKMHILLYAIMDQTELDN